MAQRVELGVKQREPGNLERHQEYGRPLAQLDRLFRRPSEPYGGEEVRPCPGKFAREHRPSLSGSHLGLLLGDCRRVRSAAYRPQPARTGQTADLVASIRRSSREARPERKSRPLRSSISPTVATNARSDFDGGCPLVFTAALGRMKASARFAVGS